MFNPRGGFPGQRPMGPPQMNQPGLNHLGMNMSGMNMSGMGMSGMNQPNVNLSGMNQSNLNTGMNRMGHPGMNPNVGIANLNQPGLNVYRMGPSGMNQGGMGFQSEVKSQGFGMRPMDSPGSFLGGNSEPMGMKNLPLRPPERHMGPQALPQRFSSPSGPMIPAQPRMHLQNQEMSMVNRGLPHSSDHLRGDVKTSLQEPHLLEKKPLNSLGMFGNLNQDMGIKPGPSLSLNQMSNAQNLYTNESASSILESFGLSNEDLEELSRYPDDQLTPQNLPNILRDIRLRKINRSGATHDQGGGGRRSGSDVLPSKVIDYGHSSKYQFNDNAAPSQPFNSSRTEQKPSPVSKEPAPSSTSNNEKSNIAMDNKIPTISSSRKSSCQTSKPNRSNNKTLVGEQTNVKNTDSLGTVLNAERPVITINPDSAPLCDIPVNSDTAATTSPSEMVPESPVRSVVMQVNYPPPVEATTATGKGNRVPALSQEEAQMKKRMPTPSMMNDYFATSPRIFPHICSLCNLECRHLKDWIKHQNNTSHIDSCRKLRQQYPDWNPQVHTLRNEGKKDETTPKRSRSKSRSPRRARRSGSRHRARRSRSRGPRSGRRSRSRSPRRSRPSPRRSRSPYKGARSPRRTLSPRKRGLDQSSTSPDRKAVDAAVQSFIEASKLKSGEKGRATKSSSDSKKLSPKSSNSSVKGKKPSDGSIPTKNPGGTVRKNSNSSSYSSSSKKPGSSSSVKSGTNSSGSGPRKPLSSNTSKKPVASSSTSRKPVMSTGAKKTTPISSSSKKIQSDKMSKTEKGPSKPTASESYSPLNKFISKSTSRKIIHVTNLPDSGYTDQDIIKIVQPFGKVYDILIIRSKNEAFLETNFWEAAAAAVKFSETVPVIFNGKRVVLSLAGKQKEQTRTETKATSDTQPEEPLPEKSSPVKEHKKEKTHKDKTPEVSKLDIGRIFGFEGSYGDIPFPNLPEKQYTVDEISNLARPFGGVSDILVISTHRKAYLELPNRNSVDSMIKFYNVFPTCLAGSMLTIAMSERFKDLKDENRIFAEIIEQSPFKITPTIFKNFVHLSDLPDREIEEFELTQIGLQFGKVEHCIVISNKRKAILHLNSPSAAEGMHTCLSQVPAKIGESVLNCTLATKTNLAEDEYMTYLEENKSSEPDYTMDEEDATLADEIGQLAKPPLFDTHVAERNVKVTGTFVKVEVEEDGDDEEAAEAPEAPEAPYCIQPEPVVEQPKYSSDPQPYVTEDSDVLVSVESDEEECDVYCPSTCNAIPVIDSVSMEHLLTAEDSEESDSNDMETSAKEMSGGCPKPVDNASAVDAQNELVGEPNPEEARNELGVEASKASDTAAGLSLEAFQASNTTPEPTNKELDDSSVINLPAGKKETSPTRAEENSDKETKSESGQKEERSKQSEETAHSYEEKSREKRERSRQSSHGRKVDEPVKEAGEKAGEESKDPKQAAVTSAASVTRMTKYNPQRGELSVTLTVDNQKSSLGTPEYRKKSSGAWASSGRESSTSKSSSNWSSPSENVYSNPKTSTGSYQSKSSYRGVSTQHRDSKYNSRSWENDFRLNRKGDQSKDSSSSSSRYVRSSTRSNRGQKSKEESASTFPFNLDEFVTVDEIVEEHADEQKPEEVEEEKSQEIAASKRMESSPAALDAKKPKEASGDTQELTFVTLDEVGDEEDITPVPERLQDGEVQTLMTVDEVQTLMTVDEVQTLMTVDEVQTLMTVDEVHSKDGPPPAAQQPSVLMTLDQVSDDEEPNISTMLSGTSAITDKDQLLTLDEISSKDEETVPNSEPLNPDIWFTQVTKESKEDNSSPAPEIKENVEAPDIPPQEPAQDSHVEQPLLTLDEVKADEEEEDSLAIEHQFLTVDEIGEEDEESEVKQDTVEKSQPKPKSKSGQSKTSKTPGGRRGRPRKRPLPETADDSKDTSQQASADSITGSGLVKTPTKPEQKAAEDPEQDKSEDSTITTPDIPGLSTSTSSDTPAKKNKLESPSLGKKTLGLFNCLIPVGLEFVVPKTGYFCELCSLFYMDDASKLKHCKSLRHYQAVQRHFAKEEDTAEEKSPST
uniref:Zinc finger protein 638 n=1 Tax=Pyxicephalus adspersus TaxID=30357 RepID=A0AAV3AVE3_PYXAD|nr:TPA: hypothetical protein GDO54_009717 [Pyxicephalus adspersus]